ncbi:MAG: class D sortase [Defluviitaleaceae bacterium]|nr:class D sortase [Defluviitaleaceae bacterium]MCL2837191.1 class D sortase [Defluviitaleaceae bacterium]
MSRKLLSKLLIIAGALCIATLIGYELAAYPWATVGADRANLVSADMPDPTIPPFDFEWMTPPPSLPTSFNINALFEPRAIGAVSVSADFDESISAMSHTGNLAMGILKIARIGLSEWVWHGTEKHQLREGVGFVPGTVLPHEPGNVVLTGHRSGIASEPFRYLHLLEIGDNVTVKCWGMNFNYQVYETFVVGSGELWVMGDVPGEDNVLTLITCDPLVWVGNRPNRLIVRARLVDITEADE